ncbi:YqgE/AlgH family protein [Glaciecola sp. XM2]|jgi:putative transcriptional regulator|uniref:YqgE/AlgH family protein n=1 Tax=Glaciecola sp. XM2 TaxID=1914931 RepID=UPI001BDF5BA8|nr:YqgE/AlgH family protein [Glaciecola sp. XM2]MBT1450448.1 YqgE/AlgH family protein [Glaciecola sp. XM2]
MTSLQNHFLVAMPALDDEYFARSVTYILEHNDQGAMGIVINQPSPMTLFDVIKQTDANAEVDEHKREQIVVFGGPVNQDRGFVLHSIQSGWNSSAKLSSEIMVTTSKDILSAIGNEHGPRQSMLALGYAGWDAGQLEQEIQSNAWLTLEADQEILFNTPIHKKWQAAVNKLGVDVWQLTQQAGHA